MSHPALIHRYRDRNGTLSVYAVYESAAAQEWGELPIGVRQSDTFTRDAQRPTVRIELLHDDDTKTSREVTKQERDTDIDLSGERLKQREFVEPDTDVRVADLPITALVILPAHREAR